MSEQPGARSIVLELARAQDGGDPFVFTLAAQDYLVRQEGGVYRTITVPWDAALLAALADAWRSRERAQEVGDRLREWLGPAGWDALAQAAGEASGERPLVVTIRAAAAELFALPWELATLDSSGRHLAESSGVVVRYEWPGAAFVAPAVVDAPRVVFAWSAAGGEVPAGEQQAALATACAAGEVEFDPARDAVPHVTTARLSAALASGRPPAVLHVLCHGRASSAAPGLVWDATGGGEAVIDGATLRALLARDAASLRLVVLSACSSGDPGAFGNHLGSVAQALHRAGVACVIASRYPLSRGGAEALTAALYDALLARGASLEQALLRVRAALCQAPELRDWASIQLYAADRGEVDTRPLALRPYRGLLAFEPAHARYFFGRDREIEALVGRLEAAAEDIEAGLQFVLGTSGSGKSSLVRGGVVPRLGPRWRVASTRPAGLDGDAAGALVAALATALAAPPPADRGPEGVAAWALAALGDDLRLLVIVDQFEEAATRIAPDAARRLCGLMQALARVRAIAVVATMRIDALERCGALEVGDSGQRLESILYDERARILLRPPDRAAVRAIVEGPAAAVGLALGSGLLERILADVDDQPGALPLLEHLLDGLWRRREGRTLTLAGYAELGGIAGALAHAAGATIAAMDATDRAIARRILTALVDLDEHGAPRGRRLAAAAELRPDDPAAAPRFERTLGRLVDGRLVVVQDMSDGSCMIDLAHEALLRGWPLLRGWIDEDRDALREVARLRQWQAHWSSLAGQPDAQLAFLGAGDRIAEVQRLAARHPELVNGPLQAFVAESAWLAGARRRRTIRQKSATVAALALLGAVFASAADPENWWTCMVGGGAIVSTFIREVLIEERVDPDFALDFVSGSVLHVALFGLAVAGFHGELAAADPRLTWPLLGLVLVRLWTYVAVVRELPVSRLQALHCAGPLLGALVLVGALLSGSPAPTSWWAASLLVEELGMLVAVFVFRVPWLPSLSEGVAVASLCRIQDMLVIGGTALALTGLVGGAERDIDKGVVLLLMIACGVFTAAGHDVRGEAELQPDGVRRLAWVLGACQILLGICCFGAFGFELARGHGGDAVIRWGWTAAVTLLAVGVVSSAVGVDPARRRDGWRLLLIMAVCVAPLPAIVNALTVGLDAGRWVQVQIAVLVAFSALLPLRRGHGARMRMRGSPAP